MSSKTFSLHLNGGKATACRVFQRFVFYVFIFLHYKRERERDLRMKRARRGKGEKLFKAWIEIPILRSTEGLGWADYTTPLQFSRPLKTKKNSNIRQKKCHLKYWRKARGSQKADKYKIRSCQIWNTRPRVITEVWPCWALLVFSGLETPCCVLLQFCPPSLSSSPLFKGEM